MRTLQLDLDSDSDAPRLVRHTVRTWLDDIDCSDETRIDVTLLVNELVTEAVHNAASRIHSQIAFDTGRLRFDIRDDRATTAPRTTMLPLDLLAEQITVAWGRSTVDADTYTWGEVFC
jgi:anti-sigma regulatory factor (Ser/Thr protein kinase)